MVHSEKKDLKEIQRPIHHVSEMMPLEKLLNYFLGKHAHLAIAVDEYGGAVGADSDLSGRAEYQITAVSTMLSHPPQRHELVPASLL